MRTTCFYGLGIQASGIQSQCSLVLSSSCLTVTYRKELAITVWGGLMQMVMICYLFPLSFIKLNTLHFLHFYVAKSQIECNRESTASFPQLHFCYGIFSTEACPPSTISWLHSPVSASTGAWVSVTEILRSGLGIRGLGLPRSF